MPPAASLSRYLSAGLVPVAIWGMVSSLVLFLIEIRTLFIQGGDERLRLAVLAFTMGVILSQRLVASQGIETASAYRWALGLAMGLFTAYHSWAYRLPVHPLAVFLANGLVFTTLWWVGTRITAACSVDDDTASAAAAETGILARARRIRRDLRDQHMEKKTSPLSRHLPGRKKNATEEFLASREGGDALWSDRLPVKHPGAIIFYFSLVAVPAFGLGSYLFPPEDAWQPGLFLFLYLWCSLSLLFLSSLNQMCAYFRRRGITFPDLVGLSWLALGFTTVSVVVLLAFLLPQPISEGTSLVRERMSATYRGLQSEKGWREHGQGHPDGVTEDGAGANGTQPDSAPSPGAAEQAAHAQASSEAGLNKAPIQEKESGLTAAQNALRKTFDFLLKVLLVLGAVAGAVTLIVMIAVLWTGFSDKLGGLRTMLTQRRRKRLTRREERRQREKLAAETFSSYSNPFSRPDPPEDGELVRYLWEATLAWCAQAGAPCSPSQTPYEYLDSQPPPLHGFEEEARRLARWYLHAEFSNRPLPESAREELRDYWSRLKAHAR